MAWQLWHVAFNWHQALKVLTDEKKGSRLKVVAFDRSPFRPFTMSAGLILWKVYNYSAKPVLLQNVASRNVNVT